MRFPISTSHHAKEGFIDNTILLTKDDADGFNKNRRARFAPLLNEDEQIFDDDQFIDPGLGGAPPRRELLPSSLNKSPPGRSSTLPPGNRPVKPNRPRKSSVGQNARKPKHERTKSKELQKRLSHDRKAFSAEPQAAIFGKRWEDLIDAAASATEEDIREREDSRDRTPVPLPSLHYTYLLPAYQILRITLPFSISLNFANVKSTHRWQEHSALRRC